MRGFVLWSRISTGSTEQVNRRMVMEKLVEESSRSKCTTCGQDTVTALTREQLTGKEIEIKLDTRPTVYRVIPSTSGMLAREDRSCLVEHKPFCQQPSKTMQSPEGSTKAK